MTRPRRAINLMTPPRRGDVAEWAGAAMMTRSSHCSASILSDLNALEQAGGADFAMPQCALKGLHGAWLDKCPHHPPDFYIGGDPAGPERADFRLGEWFGQKGASATS